jgi:hypothetical protein
MTFSRTPSGGRAESARAALALEPALDDAPARGIGVFADPRGGAQRDGFEVPVECIHKVHAVVECFEKRSIDHLLGRIRQRGAKAQKLTLLTKHEREIVSLVAQA